MNKEEKIKQGKNNRTKGTKFESLVRKDLESRGWIVSKWNNQVELLWSNKEGFTTEINEGTIFGKLIPAKRKYNPFKKVMVLGTGFPDFTCFKRNPDGNYDVIGLEVKGNGYLDQSEKQMCFWLIQNGIFSRILIAKKTKEEGKREKIEYINFSEKYKKDIIEQQYLK